MKNESLKNLLIFLCILALVVPFNSCATLLEGPKKAHERTDEIMWGFVVLDVLFTGLIGLAIDFANGAIYKSKTTTQDGGGVSYENLAPVNLCSVAKAKLAGSDPRQFTQTARDLANHVKGCFECQDALKSVSEQTVARVIDWTKAVRLPEPIMAH